MFIYESIYLSIYQLSSYVYCVRSPYESIYLSIYLLSSYVCCVRSPYPVILLLIATLLYFTLHGLYSSSYPSTWYAIATIRWPIPWLIQWIHITAFWYNIKHCNYILCSHTLYITILLWTSKWGQNLSFI